MNRISPASGLAFPRLRRAFWVFACGNPFVSLAAAANAPGGAEADSTPVRLAEFTVTSTNDRGYGATHSIGGSRINVALTEVPSYTLSLNELFIKDTGSADILDALSYVAGVVVTGGGLGGVQYSLRGYAGNGIGLRDGLPIEEGASGDPTFDDVASYERIEVIKGPAGVLYGSHSMGGIVNRVSKMPRYTRQTTAELNLSTGWQDYVRGMIDTAGPLGRDGRTAYRLVVADRRGEYAFGGRDNRLDTTVALSHHFGATRNHQAWVRARYARFEDGKEIWKFADRDGVLPAFYRGGNRSRISLPADGRGINVQRNAEIGYQTGFDAVGAKWALRVLARHAHNSGDKAPSYAGAAPVAYSSTGVRLGNNTQVSAFNPRVADWRGTMTVREFNAFTEETFGNVDLVGRLELGPSSHTLILNASAAESAGRRIFWFWNVPYSAAPAFAPNTYSLVNPERDLAGVSAEAIRRSVTTQFNPFNGETEAEREAYGVQDSIAFLRKRLIAVVGTRFDRSRSTAYQVNSQVQRTTSTNASNTAWTSKYGLVGVPTPGLSLFAHRSTTFNPVSRVDPATGAKFPNQEGVIEEIGAKFELFERRWIGTVSVFDMELSNVIINVVNPPELGGGTRPQAVGVQKTKGWEADLAFAVSREVNLVIGYSDLTSANENGTAFRGVSQTPTYTAFGKYTRRQGTLAGLGLAVGFQHSGRKPGDAQDSFRIEPYDLVDVSLSYEAPKKWEIQLKVANVFDFDDIYTAVSRNTVSPGTPRNWRLTLRRTF